VQVEGNWYGDGGIRLTAPLSPAIHLGGRRLLAISTRYQREEDERELTNIDGYPPPAQVVGAMFNAVFLDLFDNDALRLQRLNELLKQMPGGRYGELQPVKLLLLRPSRDLGRMANEFEPSLPSAFRFMTRGLGTRETRSNDLLSLVMFQPDYINHLLDLGTTDALNKMDEIKQFLRE
jgi:NTE family protein